MALNMFGKHLAREEQGGHGRRPTSTTATPSPQKAHGGAAESQAGHHHRNPTHKGVPEIEKADE